MNSKLLPSLALSPLATAIAFAVALPAHAELFTIHNQAELDTAIATIDGAANESHTITFASSLSGQTLILNPFELYEVSLTIDGEEANNLTLTIEANTSNSIYVEYTELTINAVKLNLQRSSDDLFSHATGIRLYESALNLSGATVSFTGADGDLGAIDSDESFINISNSHFKGRAGEQNRFTYALNATNTVGVTIENTVIEGMDHCCISAVNISRSYGSSSVSVVDSTFSHNRVDSNQAAALTLMGTKYGHLNVTVNRAQFFANENGGGGSAMYVGVTHSDSSMDVTIENSTFHHNQAGSGTTLRVGAEANDADLTLNLKNTTFVENESDQNPAIVTFNYENSFIDLKMSHVTIANNHANIGSWGGAVFMYSYNNPATSVQIENSIITNNGSTENYDFYFYGEVAVQAQYSLIGAERLDGAPKVTGETNLFGDAPEFGEFCDYGSGIPTLALKANSPAVDAASLSLTTASGLQEDQIGHSRVDDDAPDMGAMEYVAGLKCVEVGKPKKDKPKNDKSGETKAKKKSGGGGAMEYPVLAGLLSLIWLRRRR